MDHPTQHLNHPAEPPEAGQPTRRLGPVPRRVRRPPAQAPPAPPESDEELPEEPDHDAPPTNPTTYPCPKCGGVEVMVSVRTQGSFYLQRYFRFLNWRNSDVGAWVCTDCGYTEFYATDPANLRGD